MPLIKKKITSQNYLHCHASIYLYDVFGVVWVVETWERNVIEQEVLIVLQQRRIARGCEARLMELPTLGRRWETFSNRLMWSKTLSNIYNVCFPCFCKIKSTNRRHKWNKVFSRNILNKITLIKNSVEQIYNKVIAY